MLKGNLSCDHVIHAMSPPKLSPDLDGADYAKTTPDLARIRSARSGTHLREEAPLDESGDRKTDPPPPPDDPLVGEVLGGRYRIERKEREDDETVTFLATHARVAGYEVMVHLLAPALRDLRIERARFRGTWELLALFDAARDHIVRVEDLWDDDSHGGLVVVTEAPSGFRLDEWTAQNPPPPPLEKVVEWSRQLAVILDAMHGQGVAHGDLRPEILYLANVGPHQIVKLASFGTRRNSRHVSKLGVGRYRAPEHAANGVALGVKADVWSYGLIVYEILTGRRLWSDDTEPERLVDGNLHPRPSERAVGLRGVSAEALDAWVARCLRRDPGDRFPDVMEAWRVLQAALAPPRPRSNRSPAIAPPPSRPPPEPLPGPVVAPTARVLRGHRDTVWGLCVTGDGRTIFSAGDDGLVRAWDPLTGTLTREIKSGHVGRVRCLAVTPDGRRLVSGGHDRAVVIRDLHDSSHEIVRNALHRSIVTSVAVAPDGHWMVTTSEDGTAIVWDLTHDRALWTTPEGHGSLHAVTIGRDGDTFVTGGRDGVVRRWSLRERRCVEALEGHTGDVYALALASDGKTLVTCGKGGQSFVWRGPARAVELRGPRDTVTSVAWGVGERWLVTGSSDPDVRVWDAATGRCVQTLTGPEWAVRCVAVDPVGRYVCSAGSDSDLRIWAVGG